MVVDKDLRGHSMETLNQKKNDDECMPSVLTFKINSGDDDGMGDVDETKSMELESNGSKISVEDEDLMISDSKESAACSAGGRARNEVDTESEVVEGEAVNKKTRASLKRARDSIYEEDSVGSNWKKKSPVGQQDDESIGVVAESDGGNIYSSQGDFIILDLEVSGEESACVVDRSPLWAMLNWLNGIAKDPHDPEIGSLPDLSKWNVYGSDKLWKQVLLSREALLLERHSTLSAKRLVWQKNQRMHPSMYEDRDGSGYKLRERQFEDSFLLKASSKKVKNVSNAFLSGCHGAEEHIDNSIKSGDSSSSSAGSLFDNLGQEEVPLGSEFQAEVPEWSGVTFESDSKWLGTSIWPLKNTQRRSLIEREPIGKGRQDSCGCQVRGSAECVRFHIAEKSKRLNLELGQAFHIFKFDKMGEEVKHSWTSQEQEKFAAMVRLNPPSQGKCFWDQMFKDLPSKSRVELVSYYFNVFLMLRRRNQNSFTPLNIDSDDDEWEPGSVVRGVAHQEIRSSGSIFYSPTKPHSRCR
ncbi:ELM2 domain-containing protein [Psidium guajava]|nr:ELM2 domain-containing protein [Psidium guajava]